MINRKGCASKSPSGGVAQKEGHMDKKEEILAPDEQELIRMIRDSRDPVRALEIAVEIIVANINQICEAEHTY